MMISFGGNAEISGILRTPSSCSAVDGGRRGRYVTPSPEGRLFLYGGHRDHKLHYGIKGHLRDLPPYRVDENIIGTPSYTHSTTTHRILIIWPKRSHKRIVARTFGFPTSRTVCRPLKLMQRLGEATGRVGFILFFSP